MTRVLLTGANGALGRAVIDEIEKNAHYQIFTIARQIDNSKKNQHTIICDIRHADQLKNALDIAKPDLILHLAASFSHDISESYLTNVLPTQHFLELIKSRGLKTRVVIIGSAAEYGMVKPEENPIREDHTLCPVTVYGLSKAWQTQLLGLYASCHVDVLCARIFNLTGPGLSERLFAGRLQNQITAVKAGVKSVIEVGSLAATRDYISTKEAARQLLMIANRGNSGDIYHIASGIPINMREFLITQLQLHGLSTELIQEASDFSNRQGADVPVIFADMEKTRNLETQEQQCLNSN